MKEGHLHIKGTDWEAQGEIKGSLEELGEGDQTVVGATLDGPVDSQHHCTVPPSHCYMSSFSIPVLPDLKCSHNDLEEETITRHKKEKCQQDFTWRCFFFVFLNEHHPIFFPFRGSRHPPPLSVFSKLPPFT